MTDWFEWKGDNFYAVRGADLYFVGSAVKRAGEDKWEAYAQGEAVGLFVSQEAARRRVELVASKSRSMRRSPGRSSLADRTAGSARGRAAQAGYEPRWKFNG